MNENKHMLLLLLFVNTFPSSCATSSFQQWQCSYSEKGTVFDLLDRTTESFQTVGFPSWMSEKKNYANCLQKGFKRVPTKLRSDIEIINLAQNSIARIWKNDFATYTALVAISLVNNCLAFQNNAATIKRCASFFTAEAGAFSHLKNLTYLALDGTVMKQLPEILPKSLRILFVSISSLGPVKNIHVQHLTSLEIVSFSANCLRVDLKHFCLGNFSIEGPVFSLSKLKFLDLSYNNFIQVPNYLFQQSLLGIKLRGNPINLLRSQDFINSTNITYLNVAWTSQYTKQPLQIERGALGLLQNLRTLHLGGNMISSLPPDFFQNNSKLTYLSLGFNCLQFIESNPQLPSLPYLEELYLPGNSFCNSTIAPAKQVVSKLTLSEKYLRFPNLTTLAIGMANDIPNETFISALFTYNFLYGTIYNQVNSNSFNVLRRLSRFKRLAITSSGIQVLDTSAFSGLNLTYLDLSFNYIGEIGDKRNTRNSFLHANSIAKKHLNAVRFHYISEVFGQQAIFNSFRKSTYSQSRAHINHQQEKRIVILQRNAIFDLQRYPMEYFRSATHLHLSYNEISYVNENTLQNLLQLELLDLRFNPIRQIDSLSMSRLNLLSHLQLNFTEHHGVMSLDFLGNIPNKFMLEYGDYGYNIYRMLLYYREQNHNFSKVYSIDVSGISVPTYYLSNNRPLFKPLPNLLTLKMNNAHFTFPPQPNFFYGLSQLKKLLMRNCWLEDFPHDALTALHNLSYLDLSYNKIEVLSERNIPNLPNLETLILAYNLIHTIMPGTLQSLQTNGLTKIDLSFNQIENIGPTLISRHVLANMSRLDLRGNPIHCECSLGETFGWLVRSSRESVGVSKIPGFLPDCSYSVINYYGGCLVCSDVNCDQLLSLFTYSVTQNCQEDFLTKLVVLSVTLILVFTSLPLIYKNERVQKMIVDMLLRDVRLQHLSETKNAETTSQLLFVYDAFIFYDKNDVSVGDWVDEILIPRLESGDTKFQISVVGKDDWCGSTQVQQLLLKMKASRKTLVVLSNDFILSPQCQYVLSVLEQWTFQFKKKSCIILLYGVKASAPADVVRGCCQRNPFLELRYSPISANPIIWSCLIHAMTIPSA